VGFEAGQRVYFHQIEHLRASGVSLRIFRSMVLLLMNVLRSGGGSDYMSYTKQNYPATFATEGNPSAHTGRRWGEYDPYLHTINDTMDIDDETGFFSIDVSLIACLRRRELMCRSTWRDSRSWQLPSLLSRLDGTIVGGNLDNVVNRGANDLLEAS
jgi:hypothetical protein